MLKSVLLHGVRSFREECSIPLAKLTLLVGENSSGKTTLLAAARLAWDILSLTEPRFNEAPFLLGSYDSIAHFHGGRGKRAKSFVIGGSIEPPRFRSDKHRDDIHFHATFHASRGQPTMENWSVSQGPRSWRMNILEQTGVFTRGETTAQTTLRDELRKIPGLPLQLRRQELAYSLIESRSNPLQSAADQQWMREVAFGLLPMNVARPRAIAPIRTHPQRTYDAVKDQPNPDGEHVPVLLSRHHAEGSTEWKALERELQRFGRQSGMFQQLEVRHLGRKAETGPFQIEFAMPSQQGKRNILDVGYGVSQILPILVECMLPTPEPLLLQQPEVHLHPRAQAELGTFIAQSVKNAGRQLVVETHSDYLIDRVSLAIRAKILTPEDVSLLFFRGDSGATQVHAMKFDSGGILRDPPDSYRRFFLDEQAAVLGL